MDKFASEVATASGSPVSIITAILAFISQLLSTCPVPTPPAQIISGGGVLGQVILYRAIRAQGIRPMSAEGMKIAAAMQAEAGKLSEADAAAFLATAQQAQ